MNFLERLKKIFAKDTAVIWLLIAIGVVLYANSLHGEMFWDDDDFILNNRYIQDWQFWPHYFTDNLIAGTHLLSNYWRPLLQIVFATEWHLWADWAPGWHAVSVLVQIADASLLFLFVNALFKQRLLAFLTAIIFLVHPIQNEAIVYANSLGDGLTNFFVFGGLYLFTRWRASGRPALMSLAWWLALAAYPLALMSKETGILYLPYLLLCDWMIQHGQMNSQQTPPLWVDTSKKKSWIALPGDIPLRQKAAAIIKAVWPFILIAAIYMLLRATVLNFNNSFNFYNKTTAFTSDFGLRALTFFRVLATYAGLLFIPYDLRVERSINVPTTFLAPDILFGAALFAGIIGLAWINRRKRPIITFGILWFFAGILPTCNLFVIINAVIYEHFLFTALIGIWLIVWWSLIRWAGTHVGRTRALYAMAAVVIVAFSARVIWRNTDWRTAIGFYEKLVPTATTSYRVLNNLGMEYAEKGITDKAEATYLKAIALDPTNAVSYHNLANIYRDRGTPQDRAKAIAMFEKAISLQNDFIFSYKSLAQLYLDNKEYLKARRILERYFNLADEKPYVLQTLAKIALKEGNYPAALQYLGIALKMDPGNQEIMANIQNIRAAMK